MATPPEGPAHHARDTTIDEPVGGDGPSIAHDNTMTPVPHGGTSLSILPTGLHASRALLKELTPGVMVGEYRVEGLLGEGGMGRVYSAVHPVIGKRAAVKVLHPRLSANPEVVERFVQEARAVNQIGHPNIVDIFAFGTLPENGSYFVMEWLKGESLQERIRRQPLSRDEMCHYVTDISYALEAAHEKEIIHRDLKPENVFLQQVKGERRQIKLLDFGIAKLANTEDNRIERTRTGAMMGTPKYIAPEQARGYPVDHRADIYSLGVMVFELVANRLPFDADNAMDLVAAHLHDTPPRLSTVVSGTPRILEEIVHAMLAKDAGSRPSLARLRQVLEEVRAMPPGDAAYTEPDMAVPAVTTTRSNIAPRSKRPLVIAGVAAAGVLVGAILVIRSMKSEDETPPPASPPTKVRVEARPPEKAPAPPETPKTVIQAPGKLTVTIQKGMLGGTLVIDGKDQPGKGPWEIDLEPGEHTITLRGADPSGKVARRQQVRTEKVTIEAGRPASIELGFAPPAVMRPVVKPTTKPNNPTGLSNDDFLAPTKKP